MLFVYSLTNKLVNCQTQFFGAFFSLFVGLLVKLNLGVVCAVHFCVVSADSRDRYMVFISFVERARWLRSGRTEVFETGWRACGVSCFCRVFTLIRFATLCLHSLECDVCDSDVCLFFCE